MCAGGPAHGQIIPLVIDSSRCEACAAQRGKETTKGECITYCFCVLSVWNYNSVTIKPRRGTLPSLCKARDSCHARCSSFTRVKPTFTASARLTSPSFLERAEEKLATFLMSCTRVFYALSYLCPGKALLVLLLWWLWRSAAPVW